MTRRVDQSATLLLTVEASAERLSTSPRFIRRLIAERRIEFIKVGRHARIRESAHDAEHRMARGAGVSMRCRDPEYRLQDGAGSAVLQIQVLACS